MMSLIIWTWICLLAPAFGAAVSRVSQDRLVIWFNVFCMSVSLAASVMMAVLLQSAYVNFYIYTWLSAGLNFDFGFWLDPLSIYMALIVNIISWCVHVYSAGYMAEDPDINRYFSYVSMFTSAMLLLVLSDNLLMLFFGWEGVGVFSYLLIGFWYQKSYPEQAAFKAFLVNRIADIAMVVGMILILYQVGSLNYVVLTQNMPTLSFMSAFGISWAEIIAACLFIAAMGKSAQMPLHVWLPDSMAGPTPISALIHAATMVTAGVYLVCRLSYIFIDAEMVSNVMMILGAVQMFMMGWLALSAFDIKRIVAFSTLSQLGMMMACCAAGGYVQALFHLGSHAFFKSLLFLVCGAVIMLSDHEQDVRYTVNLAGHPLVRYSMLIGCLALSGLPPLSGFFSKDLLIESLFASSLPSSRFVEVMMLLSVVLTAAYAARLYFVVCHHSRRNVPRCLLPLTMKSILIVLSVGAVISGSVILVYLPVLSTALSISFEAVSSWQLLQEAPMHFSLYGILIAWSGVYYAYLCVPGLPNMLVSRMRTLYNFILLEYGFDWLIQRTFVPLYINISAFFARQVDWRLIDQQIVMATPSCFYAVSRVLSRLHQGRIYEYAAWMFLMAVVFVVINV